MGLVHQFTAKTVFLDTAPLIYYMEENNRYISLLDKLFKANSKGKFHFKTSVITLLKC